MLRSGDVPCVPYRLSKLTRYLQDTLHGSGAEAADLACHAEAVLHLECVSISFDYYYTRVTLIYMFLAGAVAVVVCVDPSEQQRSAGESTLSYATQMLGAKPARTA